MTISNSIFAKESLVGTKAPEFPESSVPWIGSEPLKLDQLRKEGRVVLLDFWTYSCVNCLRTLPYVKKWHNVYSSSGLTVIGVHTPEFEFEKSHENVTAVIQKEGIKYPVVLDSDYKIWNLFANHVWPRKLLIDAKGKIRYDHSGAGAYEETEKVIRELLQGTHPSATLPKMDTQDHVHIGEGAVCYPVTAETYCGYLRGQIGNEEGFVQDKFHVYKVPSMETFEDGKIYLSGGWVAKPEYTQHGVSTKEPINHLLLPYHGLEVNAVAKLDETKATRMTKGMKVYVARDHKPLDKEVGGKDILFDETGWSYLHVKEPKMYNVVNDREFGEHLLKLIPYSDTFQIYAFTFGGCAD